MKAAVCLMSCWIALTGSAWAGPPLVENAQLETMSLAGELETSIEAWAKSSNQPSWLGWHVPKLPGDQVLCCADGSDWRRDDRACLLEGTPRHFVFTSGRGPGLRPGGGNLMILLRASGGEVDDLQVYSDGCRLDASGRRLIWLEEVPSTASVDLMSELVAGSMSVDASSSLADEALMALALHAAPAAGEQLIAIAKTDSDPEIRGQALFWLSQNGAPAVSEVLLEALESDPDADVRDQAVFSLGQLPDGRGLPLLLAIARDGSRPSAVRQEAFFWLVQEGDDQAIDLIAEILNR